MTRWVRARRAVLPATVFVVVGAVLGGATYVVVRTQVDAVYAAQYEELEVIGRLRISEVEAWRTERIADAQALAGSPFFGAAVAEWVDDPDRADLAARIAERIGVAREAYDYENVLLLGVDGRLLMAAAPEHAHVAQSTLRLVESVTDPGASTRFDAPLIDDDRHHVHIDAAVAIRFPDEGPVAVLVLRSDPATALRARITAWPTRSLSGETLLVRREDNRAVFLTTPRLAGAAAPSGVSLAATDVPAVQVVLGRIGPFEGRDYRGVAVLADLRPVPGTSWFLVNKVDAAEIAAKARERGGLVLALAGLAILVAGGFAVLVFLIRQRRILDRLYEAERERTAVVRRFDEVIALARDAFLLFDPSGRIVEANQAALDLYGYPRDEMLTRTVRDLRAPEALPELERDWAAASRPEGILFDTVHRRRDGTTFPVEIGSRVLDIDGEPYHQSIIRGITERKQAEAALAGQVEELRRWNEAALGREVRVIALKQEVNALLRELGRPTRYDADAPGPGRVDDG